MGVASRIMGMDPLSDSEKKNKKTIKISTDNSTLEYGHKDY